MTELDRLKLKEIIVSRLEEMQALDAGAIENRAIVQLDQQSVGRVSRIDAIQQQQMATALKQQQRLHLQQVNRAINELDNGDYGYCQQCGDVIAFARLKARPESVMCVKCQQINE